MAAFNSFLAEHGPMLLVGVTALLTTGCVAAAACRSPLHRQRISELSLIVAIAWALLACIPLPRADWTPTQTPATVAAPPAVRLPTITEIPAELLAGSPSPRGEPVMAAPIDHASSSNMGGWLAAAFLTGSVVCATWLLLGCTLLYRVLRRSTPAPAAIVHAANALAGGARLRIRLSREIAGPVTCGVLRPVILLPDGLLADHRETQLRQTLLHEVGHVRQGDGWGNLLFCLALPLLYFHPCYWWLRRCQDLARELVVDDWAARADGKDAYVSELVALARGRLDGALGGLTGAIGIIRRRSHFYRRMLMLLQRSEPLETTCSPYWRAAMLVATLTVLGGGAALVGVRPAWAQAPSAPTAEPATPAEPAANERAAVEERLRALRDQVKAMEAELAATTATPRPTPPKSVDDSGLTIEERMRARRDRERLREEREPTASRPEASSRRNAYAPPSTRTPTRQEPGPSAALAGGVGGVQLDLVNLANSLVDASGAFKQAKVMAEAHERMNKSGAIGQSELAEGRVKLETAQKRVELLRGIAHVAMESAKSKLGVAKTRYEQGLENSDSVAEAMTNVKVLELIVRSAE
jgi:hypothetical protein